MLNDYKVVDRPVTRLPEKLIKSLERTKRDGSAIEIDVTGMTERSAKRLAERLRRQALSARNPYMVRSKLTTAGDQAMTLTVWAEELRPIDVAKGVEMRRPEMADPIDSDDSGLGDA